MSQSVNTSIPLSAADEVKLAERMISFDTSHPEGIRACAGYLKGWMEAREIECSSFNIGELPVLAASIGEGPVTVVLHAHIDVVPGAQEQFSPWQDKGLLWGRGAYDMKGATAAMFAVMADIAALAEPLGIKVRMLVVPDEESDEEREECGSELLVERGYWGDFIVCGEPTDMHVGIQAKGVLDVRVDVDGQSAHGATPWLGTNAIHRAMDVFDHLLQLPFAQESSQFFDRPSINLAKIIGGDRLNLVPDRCSMYVDIRYLPEQPLDRVRRELASLPGCEVHELFWRQPAMVTPDNPFVQLLRSSIDRQDADHHVQLVGRDGANDGIYFLQRGMPSVEFGPIGSGHHSPEEHVSVESLRTYRRALLEFLVRVSENREDLTGLTHVIAPASHREEPRSLL